VVVIRLSKNFVHDVVAHFSVHDVLALNNYSQAAHWLSLPAVIKPVDVFYLYMTAWTSTDPANPHICAIDEPTMLIKAPETFAQQATAFETVGNIYAPFYRQDNGC
jgi:hypothetical protein